ncbi:MAG: hypothetical protein CFE44_16465, partial [Burkholderiales bacterium PBB4]
GKVDLRAALRSENPEAALADAFSRAKGIGVNIEAIWADDEAKAENTAKLVEQFARDQSIVATTGIVGTPHAKAAVPRAVAGGLPVVGIRSGAAELRDGAKGVYHLRASYTDELTNMVKVIHGAGLERLAVVYSDDAFGTAAAAHVTKAAAALGVQLVSNVPADRSGSNVVAAVSQAVAPAKQASALLMLVLEGPMITGVAHARRALSFVNPVFCMSFCATKRLAESTEQNLVGLGLVSAFPLPRTDLSVLAERFRQSAQTWHRPGVIHSLTAFEGFLYGSVLTSSLMRAREPSRQGLLTALAPPQEVGGIRVDFDTRNVGYHYLQLVYKSATGVLRA